MERASKQSLQNEREKKRQNSQYSNKDFNYQQVKCQCGSQANFICVDNQCQKYAFMCEDQKNTCKFDQHQNCLKISFKAFTKKIQSKILTFPNLIEYHDKMVDQFIDKVIDQASKMKDLFKKYVQQNYKYAYLSEGQKQFLGYIQKNNTSQLRPYEIGILLLSLNQNSKDQKLIKAPQQYTKKMQKMWKQVQNKLMFELQKIQQDLIVKQIPKSQILKKKFQKSNLIKTEQQEKIILNFFDKKVKDATLLYKASQNDFKLANYYSNCTNISNTLVILQSQFNKKIGGFTPLCWKKGDSSQVDASNSSFIFSLTNNQKLKQKDTKSSGIRNNQNYGPGFGISNGRVDILISNQVNKNSSSYGCFNFGYSNETYTKQNKQLYQRFCGNPNGSYSIKLKQWEVWKIQFQN